MTLRCLVKVPGIFSALLFPAMSTKKGRQMTSAIGASAIVATSFPQLNMRGFNFKSQPSADFPYLRKAILQNCFHFESHCGGNRVYPPSLRATFADFGCISFHSYKKVVSQNR